jgi:hypothetical protein
MEGFYMKRIYSFWIIFLAVVFVVFLTTTSKGNQADAAYDYDISPFFVDGELVIGGLDHYTNREDPPVKVFNYEFSDTYDPYNISDPGINQAAGVGTLPAGGKIRYNILSSLLYWEGQGYVNFTTPPDQTYLTMTVNSVVRTLTGTSGAQTGYLIQTIIDEGNGSFLHKHMTTSLYAAPNTSNVPGYPGYEAPPDGIYVYSIELTLTYNSVTYTSDPIWIVWNCGMDDAVVADAVYYFDPLPGDANRDGEVNVSDLSLLATNYGTTGNATWAMGDFNDDGAVNVSDLSLLAANYGTGSTSTLSWADAYAQAFGTTSDAEDDSSEVTDDDISTSSVCSSLGLALITAMVLMGLMLVKLEV